MENTLTRDGIDAQFEEMTKNVTFPVAPYYGGLKYTAAWWAAQRNVR